jgi:Protein of unknown function (DUF1203)
VPVQFRTRRQILRPYGRDRRIAYDRLRLVRPDGDIDRAIAELLDMEDIAFVQVRNPLSGCYSFAAERADPTESSRDATSGMSGA